MHPPDFRRVFEGVPGLYLVLSPVLTIEAVTDAYCRATMTVREQIVGRHIFEVFPDNPADASADGVGNLRASLERVVAELQPDTMAVQRYDIPRPAEAGGGFEVRHWSPRNTPILDEQGRLDHIIHAVEDVTAFVELQCRAETGGPVAEELRERTRQMEAEILQRSQELQGANNRLRTTGLARNQFMSRMSHELRTPLTSILGYSELIALHEVSPDVRMHNAAVLRAGEHLLGLINDVLDVARVDAGQLGVELQSVALDEAVTEALELVSPLAAARGISIDRPHDCGHLYVHADPQRLRQVVVNLVSNAVKFNREGGRVGIAIQCQPDRFCRVEVSDEGPGIAAADVDRLFTPFERLDAAARGIEGTGLGLALSRNLVEAMGGTIGVEPSTPGGATFWLEIPRLEPAAALVAAVESPAVAEVRDYTEPRLLLYVDDSLANLQLVEQLVRRRPSITMVPVMLGALAVSMARTHRPDLILLDLHLPDVSGDQVLARLRADPELGEIPTVVLSADATAATQRRLKAARVTDYLTKPIGVAHLLDVLDRYLAN